MEDIANIIIVAIIALLIISLASGLLVWKHGPLPSRVTLDNGGQAVSYSGTFAGAVMLASIASIVFCVNTVTELGVDSSDPIIQGNRGEAQSIDSSDQVLGYLLNELIGIKSAQAQQVTNTETLRNSNNLKGWAYLGPDEDQSDWYFDDLGSEAGKKILQAKGKINLREKHLSGLQGTSLGKAFGVKVPKSLKVIQKGDCVLMSEQKTIGLGRVWGEVETIPCPSH
ncbi:MAG: hypothetical protein V7776_11655 [Halopseudomonas aestusnigri]